MPFISIDYTELVPGTFKAVLVGDDILNQKRFTGGGCPIKAWEEAMAYVGIGEKVYSSSVSQFIQDDPAYIGGFEAADLADWQVVAPQIARLLMHIYYDEKGWFDEFNLRAWAEKYVQEDALAKAVYMVTRCTYWFTPELDQFKYLAPLEGMKSLRVADPVLHPATIATMKTYVQAIEVEPYDEEEDEGFDLPDLGTKLWLVGKVGIDAGSLHLITDDEEIFIDTGGDGLVTVFFAADTQPDRFPYPEIKHIVLDFGRAFGVCGDERDEGQAYICHRTVLADAPDGISVRHPVYHMRLFAPTHGNGLKRGIWTYKRAGWWMILTPPTEEE